MRPQFLRLHHRIDGADGAEESEQFGVELLLHVVVVEGGEAAGIHLAGIVDEDVDTAEFFLGGRHHFRDVGFSCHVGNDGVHLATGALGQFAAGLVEFHFVAAGDQHAHALFQKLARRFKTDSATAASDNRAAALDPKIHSLPPSP